MSGAAASGVTISLAEVPGARVTSDGTGAYAFSGLGNGVYTITPTLAGYTFSPSSIQVTVSGASISGQDFTATAAFDVQAALQGTWVACAAFGGSSDRLTMTFSGSSLTASAETFPNGSCAGAGTPSDGGAGTFMVGPAVIAGLGAAQVTAYQFDPTTDQTYYDLVYIDTGAAPPRLYVGDSSGVNDGTTPAKRPTTLDTTTPFVKQAGPYRISGTVGGAVAAGVTVSLGGDASATTTTGGAGVYVFTGLANGSYTVTPSMAEYAFSPTSLPVTVSGANVNGQDFTATGAHTISGSVAGAIAAGITVTLAGDRSGWTTTDATGAYSFSGLPDGTYYVGPSQAGYAFSPTSVSVVLSGGSIAGRDFTATAAVPCTTFAGSVEIRNSLDWKALLDRGCTAISGELVIGAPDLAGAVSLPALESVGGTLWVANNTVMTAFGLPALTSVGGSLKIDSNPAMSSFSLPALTAVGLDVQIAINDALSSFSLPALATVGGLGIHANPALTDFSLPALTTVTTWGLGIADNPSLTGFSLPALTTSPGLSVQNNAALPGFTVPALTSVGALAVGENATLTAFSLPALTGVAGYLQILRGAALTSFDLPALTTVGGALGIIDNVVFPQCLAVAFKDHLVTAHGYTGPWTISGNDTTAICPP